ncbi:hypothetical protein QYE76_067213 [Lolium multiflorum]|uniref:Retrotransposon gag domain-containing protein n=1 Tax=Lolium multiflorum TaxID=4521 RepID=A0AAD8SDW8_LOLMU|nr:hypothetical protein QYE76_067213 [Lolium multiflorum]
MTGCFWFSLLVLLMSCIIMPPRRRGRARGRAGRNGRAEEHSHREDEEVSQSGNSDGQGASTMTLTKWLDMKLDKFDGSGTPMDAASWLRTMEKYMDASVMTLEDRVVYVAFQLKGLADDWWEGVRAAWSPAHGQLTWDVFVKQFTRKYYPTSFKEKMDVALRNIKQGDKTVDEYETEFSKIVHFVEHINRNDCEKARRFFEGLSSEYRHVMGANRPNDYFTVVEQARGLELQYQLTETEAARTCGTNNRAGGDHKRSYYPHESGFTRPSQFKKSRIVQESQQFSPLTLNVRSDPGHGMVCYKCGENHRAAECNFSGNCDHCSKTGHKSIVCRRNPNSIINSKKDNSSSRVPSNPLYEANPGRSSQASVQMMTTPPFVPAPYTPLPPGYVWSATPLPVPLVLPAPTIVPQPPQQFPGGYAAPGPSGVCMTSKTPSRSHADGVSGFRVSSAGVAHRFERSS